MVERISLVTRNEWIFKRDCSASKYQKIAALTAQLYKKLFVKCF